MNTLDQILTQRVIEEHKESMAKTLDLTTWTTENRDERMQAARMLGERIAKRGVELVEETLSREIEGNSLFHYILLTAVIVGELELLYSMREELDTTPEEELSLIPVDTPWLATEIRRRIQELSDLHLKITSGLSVETEAKEL